VASFIYRVIVCVGIILFVADKFFLVGAVMAAVSVVTWVVVPLGKWFSYMATSPELIRTRSRSVGLTVGTFGVLALALCAIPVTEYHRTQGVVEPVRYVAVHMGQAGFVEQTLPTGQTVSPDGPPLIQATNIDLHAKRQAGLAKRAEAEAQLRQAQSQDLALAQALTKKIEAINRQLVRVDEQLAALAPRAPFAGTWLAPDGDSYCGAYVARGKRLGIVASLDELVIRAVADQQLGPRVKAEAGVGSVVEMRVDRRPDIQLRGVIQRISEAGTQELPSPAFSTRVGGNVDVRPDDEKGTKATVPHFEIRIAPDVGTATAPLHAGQRVVVRIALPPKPLIVQFWRWTRQLLQQRFQI
jgi:putative peptide zinc metalloprotease protein